MIESPSLEAQRYGRRRKGRMEEGGKEEETKETGDEGGWEVCRWAKIWGDWSKIREALSGIFRYCR